MTYVQTDKVDNLVVTLPITKSHAVIDTSIDDELITEYIKAATRAAEKLMSRDILTTTYENYRPRFFDDLTLRRGKFQLLEKIEFLKDDVYTLLPATEYTVQIGGIFGCICELEPPNDIDESCNAVRITFKTGFGDKGDDVPSDIKLAIMSHVASIYENRGDCKSPNAGNIPEESRRVYENCKIIDIVGDEPLDFV